MSPDQRRRCAASIEFICRKLPAKVAVFLRSVGCAGHEHSLDPVACGLWACRQLRRGVRLAAARHRGLAGPHRAVLQPSGLWRLPRPCLRRRPDRRRGAGHRGARRAQVLRRRAVGLCRLRRDRPCDRRCRRPRQARQSAGALLLRPGDRRHRQGRLCPARRRRVHPGAHAARGRRRDAEPVRTRPSDRPQHAQHGRGAAGRAGAARARAAHRAGDVDRQRRDAGRTRRNSPSATTPAPIVFARRSCRLPPTAPATSLPRCFSRIFFAPALPQTRCLTRPPRCSAFSSGRRRRARAKSC